MLLDVIDDQGRDLGSLAPFGLEVALAGLGNLLASIGDDEGSLKAFGEAKKIVEGIAANVSDETLRKTFMESHAVQEVVSGVRTA